MTPGTERHLYAGGNTSLGFYSFYDQIVLPHARCVYLLKGGPGTGKSTFMRHIGARMQELGHVVEYFHCSSDNDSLDGVHLPKLGIALIDGTAPHVVDPKHPGAVDKILHLGDFWDEAGIRSHQADVLAITNAISRAFRRAYCYLAAAKDVYDDIEAASQEGFDRGRANGVAASLIQSIFGHRPVSHDVGRARHLFASALTPAGPRCFLDNLLAPIEHKYILQGSPGTGRSTIVKKVVDAAVERGFYVEAYHCAFDPAKYEHAIIPALRAAVVTSAPPHVYSAPDATTINMDRYCSQAAMEANATRVSEDNRLFAELMDAANNTLATAKQLHDKLEEHYVPYMDFSRIETLRDQVLAHIEQQAAALN